VSEALAKLDGVVNFQHAAFTELINVVFLAACDMAEIKEIGSVCADMQSQQHARLMSTDVYSFIQFYAEEVLQDILRTASYVIACRSPAVAKASHGILSADELGATVHVWTSNRTGEWFDRFFVFPCWVCSAHEKIEAFHARTDGIIKSNQENTDLDTVLPWVAQYNHVIPVSFGTSMQKKVGHARFPGATCQRARKRGPQKAIKRQRNGGRNSLRTSSKAKTNEAASPDRTSSPAFPPPFGSTS